MKKIHRVVFGVISIITSIPPLIFCMAVPTFLIIYTQLIGSEKSTLNSLLIIFTPRLSDLKTTIGIYGILFYWIAFFYINIYLLLGKKIRIFPQLYCLAVILIAAYCTVIAELEYYDRDLLFGKFSAFHAVYFMSLLFILNRDKVLKANASN